MKHQYCITAIVLILSLLSGCIGISPYRQEFGFMFVGFGGYRDSKEANGNYLVFYSSGHAAFHSKEKVRDFSLRRACELTMENGFKGFQIVEERGDEYECVFQIHLTDSCGENVLNAQTTLSTLHEKYK